MEPPNKRQRIVTGCLACRERHLRCDEREPCCRQCESNGLDCVRQLNVRFRSSASASSRDSSVGMFPADQKWLPPPMCLQFRDETSDIAQGYEQAEWEANAPFGTIVNFLNADSRSQSYESAPSVMNTASMISARSNITLPVIPAERSAVEAHPYKSPAQDYVTVVNQLLHSRPSPVRPVTSPLTIESPASLKSVSIHLDNRPMQASFVKPFTDREAELLRNFSENMALWSDITDIERHFEIEVPRRAYFNPILRYAIFAFSSRHMNRFEGGNWEEALNYHNKCLELLIPILSDHSYAPTDEILAAVAILREDEEMEDEDNCFHLDGVTRILNQMSSLCSSGGLGEAAAWLCLRQDIYVSLVSQRPLRTQLSNFEHSSSLKKNDDMSWANKMVLLLAKILSIAFLEPTADNDSSLKQAGEEVEQWMRNKPVTFEPIRYAPRDKKSDNRFPVVWLLNTFHVIGVQYYHIAKIVLAASSSQPDQKQRYFVRWGRDVERRVRSHLLTVVGLAKSNPRAENTLFTARHCLSVWGGVLTSKLDQEAAKAFLQEMEKRTGWSMSKLITHLTEQWDDSDDN